MTHRRHYQAKTNRTRPIFLLLLVMMFLNACATSSEDLILATEHANAGTAISNIRGTATVVRARMQTTLDYAGTRVVDVEQMGQFMQSTLVALGTERAFISENLPQIDNVMIPTFTPQPTSPINIVTPAQSPNVTPPADPNSTPADTTLTPESAQPRLDNIVLASGVNDNDCAVDTNPRFTTRSTEIYVVAVAHNIPAGSTISSTWQRNGTEVALFSFQPETNIDNNCIWFFIDQSDAEFIPTSWSVELKVDDVSVAPPVSFQIIDG